MYLRDRTPAWHRDAKWASGVALVLVVAVGTLFAGLAQVSERERAVPVLREALQVTLLADGAETSLRVRRAAGYVAGESLPVLPGTTVQVDVTEIPDFGADAALSRLAGTWTERLLSGGADAMLATVDDPTLEMQLRRALDGAGGRLLAVSLESAMLPAGLGDGSRMANWPLQAQQNPGAPVQPIVGVLVRVDPGALRNMDTRQVGEAVIARLAELALEDGADAAREPIRNATLEQRLEMGLERGRAELHELFETLLLPQRAQVDERLQEARAVLADEQREAPGLAGLLPEAELSELPPEEANRRVLTSLAERSWEEGPDALPALLEPSGRAERVAAARPVLRALSSDARARYLRWAWISGAAAVLLLLALVAASRGWGRAFNPGVALALAGAAGAVAFTRLAGALRGGGDAPPPAAADPGVFAQLRGLLGQLAARVPPETVDVLARYHLAVVAAGVALMALALIGWAAGRFRPRRRAYL